MAAHLVHRSHNARPLEHVTVNDNDEEAAKSHHGQCKRRAPLVCLRRRPRTTSFVTFCLLVMIYAVIYRRHDTPLPHKYPIMVQSMSERHALPLILTNHPTRYVTDRRNHYWLDHGVESWRRPSSPEEGCNILNEHARDHNLNCNNIHSVDMTDFWLFDDRRTITLEGKNRQSKFRHIGEGGFRNAFYISEYNGERRVLKTLVWRDDRYFDISNMERNRKDAVIASQLTSSPVVADIYGYCAQAAIVDYSDDYDLYYLFDVEDDDELPSRGELFGLAVDVAQSVADSHLPNKDGKATVVHMDLKPDQWIRLNGKYVLNDFNLAKFIEYNYEKQEYCSMASGYSEGRWQAPEQFTESYPRTEKADVFSLGYILNFLLTQKKPFPEKSGEEVQKYVENGGIWKVPTEYMKSSHPFHVAVRQAIQDCLQFKPHERPSAQQIADQLRTARDAYKRDKEKREKQ